MKRLLFATGNDGKAGELRELMAGNDVEILTLKDFPDFDAPPETGQTFAENAILKARAAAVHSGLPTLADDSGLCVDALGGAPGVYSARYGGDGRSETNIAKLLAALKDVPATGRQAHFACVLALALPNGETFTTEGRVDGEIIDQHRGDGGFGYDPIFYLPDKGRTMAQLAADEKNAISHRGRAFASMKHTILEKLAPPAVSS